MMPPPIHMQAEINSGRLCVEKLLDEIINILSSDGPFVSILSKPNVDLSEKLEMWTFATEKFIEFMAPRIIFIPIPIIHFFKII